MLSVCVVVFFLLLDIIKENPYLNKSTARQSRSFLPRSEQLNLSVCARLCAALECVCMHSNVCFNVLTYATPYKQCFMQTVAALPSDKAPEQEKETALWGREGWRKGRMSEGWTQRQCEKQARNIEAKKMSLLNIWRQLNK